VSQGLKCSSLSQVGALITVLDGARPALTSIYLLALRVTPMLTLLLAGGHMSTAMMTTTAGIFEWLPVSFATLLFGEAGIALALLIGSGLATRATALLASALRSTWTARWGPADDLPLIGKPTCVRDAHPIDGLHVGARPKCEVRERPPLRRLSGLRGHQSWRRTIAIYEYPPFCNRIPPR